MIKEDKIHSEQVREIRLAKTEVVEKGGSFDTDDRKVKWVL